MTPATNSKRYITRWVLLIALLSVGITPCFSSDILFANLLPTANLNGFPAATTRSNVAPIYNAPPLPNASSVVEDYILGDRFVLFGTSNTIDSVTIYEVGNVATTQQGVATDTPDTEFSDLSLYIGLDNSATGLGSAVSVLAGAALQAASTQVFYSNGDNYQSVNSDSYFPIFAVTFSGLNLDLAPGIYDFAIGATPISTNTFALHTSDPAQSNAQEDATVLAPDNSFLYFFPDGTAGAPLETYQYVAGLGLINNWTNTDALDANVIITGTSIPEPATFGIMAFALAGLTLGLRRRRRGC